MSALASIAFLAALASPIVGAAVVEPRWWDKSPAPYWANLTSCVGENIAYSCENTVRRHFIRQSGLVKRSHRYPRHSCLYASRIFMDNAGWGIGRVDCHQEHLLHADPGWFGAPDSVLGYLHRSRGPWPALTGQVLDDPRESILFLIGDSRNRGRWSDVGVCWSPDLIVVMCESTRTAGIVARLL